MTTTQNKFAEIEAAIRRQQHSIRQHQEELTHINERTLTTLSLVQTTAGDVLQLTDDTTRQFQELRNELRREAAAQATAQQIGFDNMTALFQSMSNNMLPTTRLEPTSTQPSSLSPTHFETQAEDSDSEALIDDMSTDTEETDNHSSTHAKSPVKKKNKTRASDLSLRSIRRSLNSPTTPFDDQEPSAQNQDSTPGEGDA